MSEYTPSTDEVRGAWIALTYNNTPEEFDRWLAVVKAEAWEEGKEYGERRANREIPSQLNPYYKETE